jgi:tetratricopeptide (TPR) repeat protein
MKNTAHMIAKATTDHQAGRYPDAEKTYKKILKLDQTNRDALRLLGGLYLQIDQPAQAEKYLEKAAQVYPDDAEIINNLGVALRNQGKISHAIPCYQRAVQIKPDYYQAFNNLGGALFETGQPVLAVTFYKKSLALNPCNPQAHYNLGNALRLLGFTTDAIAAYEEALRLHKAYPDALTNLGLAFAEQGQFEKAQELCKQALAIDPHNMRALNNYGNVLREIGKPEDALFLYQQALVLKPDYTDAYINMGTVFRDIGHHAQAFQCFTEALRLNPQATEAMVNSGTLMLDLGRHREAISHYDDALRLKPDSANAKWGKSLALLACGDYKEGWILYDAGLNNKRARGYIPFPHPLWDGQDFAHKRLLIWSEQGFGDSLQFIRYASLCKMRGGEVLVLCPDPLAKLFINCSAIDKVVTKVNAQDFDIQIPMLSLPRVFGTDVDTIPAAVPYLHIDSETQKKWAPRFADSSAFKVGLVWAGSAREHQPNAHLIDKRRSISLELIKPILNVQPALFYSLQMGKAAAQIDACGLQNQINCCMTDVTDFLDTAAIIDKLDLVITVDTSVAHLAGGLGKAVWILSRYDACWRWMGNKETNPWYPTARIFGQPAPGDWQSVIYNICQALQAELTRHNI